MFWFVQTLECREPIKTGHLFTIPDTFLNLNIKDRVYVSDPSVEIVWFHIIYSLEKAEGFLSLRERSVQLMESLYYIN